MISAQSRSRTSQFSGNMRAHRFLSTALFSSSSIRTTTTNTQKNITAIASAANTFKAWPKPYIESKGDYTEESFLEEYIGGPLYRHQAGLPHLPIPCVEETISLFMKSALPLVESEEERLALIKDCDSFPMDVAELQKRLLRRKEECSKLSTSWLQLWWNQLGYLQIRDPNVVNVSYFFQIDDDKSLPAPSSINELQENNQFNLGIKRGAAVLTAVAEHRRLVCSGTLPMETIGKNHNNEKQLCSVGFKYMFHGCRIPKPKSDTFKIYDPSRYKHCIIACKGQFYAMDFVDKDDNPLPLNVLESGLEKCVHMANDAVEHGLANPHLGLFTASDRESWADVRSELLRLGGERMEKAFTLLESGAFLLCLDETAPVTRTECSKVYFHGDTISGPNRWFDKSMQFLCQSNGKLGFMGEHSMVDGMPLVALCSRIKQTQYGLLKNQCRDKGNEKNVGVDIPPIQIIFEDALGTLDSQESKRIEQLLDNAKHDYESLVDKQELQVLSFQSYGSDYIKKAKYSPDGLVQMALQLASYRLFGKQVGTYESSQVRFFLHGRTETTRSVSEASEAFVNAMGLHPHYYNPTVDFSQQRQEKLSLLKAATEYHSNYLKLSSHAHGVDRHFFGLSMVAKENENIPLFSNPVFVRSKTWKLSTSTLPNIPGFGPVVEDGIGVGYEVRPECCFFTITSRKEYGYSESLCHLLEESLLEIQALIDSENPPKSKL